MLSRLPYSFLSVFRGPKHQHLPLQRPPESPRLEPLLPCLLFPPKNDFVELRSPPLMGLLNDRVGAP